MVQADLPCVVDKLPIFLPSSAPFFRRGNTEELVAPENPQSSAEVDRCRAVGTLGPRALRLRPQRHLPDLMCCLFAHSVCFAPLHFAFWQGGLDTLWLSYVPSPLPAPVFSVRRHSVLPSDGGSFFWVALPDHSGCMHISFFLNCVCVLFFVFNPFCSLQLFLCLSPVPGPELLESRSSKHFYFLFFY